MNYACQRPLLGALIQYAYAPMHYACRWLLPGAPMPGALRLDLTAFFKTGILKNPEISPFQLGYDIQLYEENIFKSRHCCVMYFVFEKTILRTKKYTFTHYVV
jgi:hypothetical protein